jgi:hypothetical protein
VRRHHALGVFDQLGDVAEILVGVEVLDLQRRAADLGDGGVAELFVMALRPLEVVGQGAQVVQAAGPFREDVAIDAGRIRGLLDQFDLDRAGLRHRQLHLQLGGLAAMGDRALALGQDQERADAVGGGPLPAGFEQVVDDPGDLKEAVFALGPAALVEVVEGRALRRGRGFSGHRRPPLP